MVRLIPILLLATPFAVVAAPVPPETDAARMARIYGTKADPGDAHFVMVGDKLRLMIPARELPPWYIRAETEPGAPAHFAARLWKPTPDFAPRLWKEVEGDFTAVARVSFCFRPANPKTWFIHPRAAGLFAWSGDGDHFGLMRCEEYPKAGPTEAFRTILTQPGRVRTSAGALPRPGEAAYLRLKRAGSVVTGAYSRDGKEWTEFLPDEVEWTGPVKVGVYAKHFSDAALDVTFDEYTLTVPKK